MFGGVEGRSSTGGMGEDCRVEDPKGAVSLVNCVVSGGAEGDWLSDDTSGVSWVLSEGFKCREGRLSSICWRTNSSARIAVTVYHLRALVKRRLIPS